MSTLTSKNCKAKKRLSPLPPKENRGNPFWFVLLFAVVFALVLVSVIPSEKEPETEAKTTGEIRLAPWIEPMLLDVDGVSRRGVKLEELNNIVVHYVGNPNTTAVANRNWFNSPESETSSHFIVGLEGEVIQCIPLEEKSSATNERNRDTISIEVCHPDESGKFSEVTRKSLIRLLAFLCEKFNLTEEDLIRHYDVTGKLCPLYYVENEDEWLLLKADVKRALEGEALWEE